MKKGSKIIFVFLLLSASICAQDRVAFKKKTADRNMLINKIQVDTLDYFNGDGVTYITGDSGYVAGTNEYDDKGKYQRFDISGSVSVTHAYIAFSEIEIRPAGSPDDINLVVRSVNPNGSPGTLLSSKIISTADFNTTSLDIFEFDAPVSAENSFFVGLEWETEWADSNADRFSLAADEVGDGNGAKRAWEKWFDDSLTSIQDTWSTGENEMDVDLWIGVFFDAVTSVKPDPSVTVNSYSLSQNYPNPFNPVTIIKYSIPYESNVKLTVYNALGETISEVINSIQNPGAYQAEFNAELLSSGLYFYKIEANALNGSGQFLEIKKMMLLK
ncbi:MAG: T9SS type A sorting domain-containing protein [Ignavibacteriaceae bacterium]